MNRRFWILAAVLLPILLLLSFEILCTGGEQPACAWWRDHRVTDGIVVFFIGVTVGAGELISRYKTDPWRAIESKPGVVYMAVNGLAAVLALVIVYAADFRFGIGPAAPNEAANSPSDFWDDATKVRFLRILVAGFGAMALFRSSFFNVRVGDRDVPVGFSVALKAILDAVDRAVDRLEALHRHLVVADRLLKYRLTFNAVKVALPAYCFALLQNLTGEEQAAVGEQIKKIIEAGATMTETDQLRLLYLQLLTVVGEDVLEQAVKLFSKPADGS